MPLTSDFECTDSDVSSVDAGQTTAAMVICFIIQATKERIPG